jgi:hypothetical protein
VSFKALERTSLLKSSPQCVLLILQTHLVGIRNKMHEPSSLSQKDIRRARPYPPERKRENLLLSLLTGRNNFFIKH